MSLMHRTVNQSRSGAFLKKNADQKGIWCLKRIAIVPRVVGANIVALALSIVMFHRGF